MAGEKKNKPNLRPIDHDEVQRIVSAQIRSLHKDQVAPVQPKWWNSPWLIAIGSAILGVLIANFFGLWQSGKAHDAQDLKNSIQLEVGSQLAPFNERLERQGEDVAKIKGALGIALNDLKNTPQNVFAQSLPALQAAIKQIPPSPAMPDQATVREIADKLRHTDESAPEYWRTVLQFISFASSRFIRDVPPPGPPWALESVQGNFSGRQDHGAILVDGGIITDFTCEKCRIVFTQKPVKLRNVTFIDCVFDFPDGQPSPVIKEAARVLLAAGIQKATIPAIG